ncbi:hypothetical protein, conserved [Leishmania tarentolae]|uniref:Uncharacterized protein n=1 Tax=Leishmania tarentolae TaxID=5689 RepID=A0A640KCX0_LEITA|nr:hypothetical protein, conserved [Leishmania tarentolae]
MDALVGPKQASSQVCGPSLRTVQRRVCGVCGWTTLSRCLHRLMLMALMPLLLSLFETSVSCPRGGDNHVLRLSRDAYLMRSAATQLQVSSETNGCPAQLRIRVDPGVLMAQAAMAESPTADSDEDWDGSDVWATVAMKGTLNYDSGLKPFMTPWREVRRALREAGCFSTLALPRRTLPADTVIPRASSASTESSTTLPPLCRKPLVLMSGRGRDCGSCSNFAADVLEHYRAEWEYIRAHVTLVDAGDPMTEELVQNPYPLWYNTAELGQWLKLTKISEKTRNAGDDVVTAASGASSTPEASFHDAAQALQQSEAEDYSFFNMGLHRKAAALLQSPTVQATHHWSRLVKRAFAGQSEYVLRIVFAYPHNGSVMRDVVNEEVTAGGSYASYLHFFNHARPFFDCVKKAIRVMERLQRYGDY